MAAELQETDPTLPSCKATSVASPLAPPPTATAIPSAAISPVVHHVQPEPENRGPTLATKRQRRPSVRLGEIGHQSFDSQSRRTKNQHNPPGRYLSTSAKSVRARSITNLVNGGGDENEDNIQNGNTRSNNNNLEFSHRKSKAKRGSTKRVRSNWIPRHDGGFEPENSGDDGEEGFRDFDPDSDSQLKDQSPIHSADNAALYNWQRRAGSGPSRARVSDIDAIEMDTPESDNDRRCGTSEWVRSWLIELGLSRYAPVFQIHEVDDEVLPLLMLEDLKDMGINAVGSRRKLYAAIQKLRNEYS